MKHFSAWLFPCFLCFIFTSCQKPTFQDILHKANHYLHTHVDSVAFWLGKLPPIETLSPDEMAQYALIKTQYTHFSGKRILTDSLITISETYFRNNRDTLHWKQSLTHKAWIYFRKGDFPHAISLYEELLDLSLASGDSVWVCQTYRELYFLCERTSGKIDYFGNYVTDYETYISKNPLLPDVICLGDYYSKTNELEKAETYYLMALRSEDKDAYRYSDQEMRNKLVQLYASKGMSEKAFAQLDSFKYFSRGRYENAYGILARANVWKSISQNDSAFYYYTLASESLNPYVAAEAYRQLALFYNSRKEFDPAFSALQNSQRLIDNERTAIHATNLEALYREEKLKNELSTIKLAKKSRELYLVILSTVIFLSLVIGYLFYMRNKRRKEEHRLKEQTNLLEKENLLLKQAEELSTLREKEAMLRESLFRRMNAASKIPSLETGEDTDRGDKRIVLSPTDWEEIVQIVNDSYDCFAGRLRNNYPLLTEKDIQFCCLVKINVTLKDLSDIYCVSKSAVTKKKFRIKTEKIGFKDGDQSLDDFLQDF